MALLNAALLTELATPGDLPSNISTVTSAAPRHNGDTRVFVDSDNKDASIWRAFGTTSADWKCLFSRRIASASPVSSVTPRCAGDLYIDDSVSPANVYIAAGVSSGDWRLLTGGTGGGGGGGGGGS